MLAVRAEHAFDGESFTHGGVTVLCVDGRIAGVERGHPEMGPPWQVLAVPGGTVLPGLIDTHVHLVGDSKPGALDRVAGCTEVELDQIITEGAAPSARRWSEHCARSRGPELERGRPA